MQKRRRAHRRQPPDHYGIRAPKHGRPSRTAAVTALAAVAWPQTAWAQGVEPGARFFGIPLETFEVVQFSLFAGALAAAIGFALWLIRERAATASQNIALRGRVSAMSARLNQLETLSTSEGQRAVIWNDKQRKPAAVIGTLDRSSGAPQNASEFLAFGRWLEPMSVMRLEQAIARLREAAQTFNDVVQTTMGVPIEVSGRTSGGSAVVRFANLAGERAHFARLSGQHERIVDTLETLQALIDKADMPVWLRDQDDTLAWVNKAFAQAVECDTADAVIAQNMELFGGQATRKIAAGRHEQDHFNDQVTTVVRGDRAVYDVLDVSGPFGSAGIALDRTETEQVRAELNTTIRSHEETLDRLTTAVAMFDTEEKLRFYNQAFAELWQLERGFLDNGPEMALVLDRLRADGKLPEQPEWRRWKDELLSGFKAIDPQEHWWYLPDGRSVRVIGNPHPRGGMTWVFENLTEHIDLESKYKTLMRVQDETLDNLAEGVAVFDADGTLRLANPAFERFWKVQHLMDGDRRVHIAAIAESCAAQFGSPGPWEQFAGVVTGFDEDRSDDTGKTAAGDRMLSWMVAPLPNGQTMISFVDITAADQIERALRERNDALERTTLLRDRFIRHVSHGLRVPLTSIGGFAELLAMADSGPLNTRQSELLSHVLASTEELRALTDNVIDLATIDAGIMELDLATVDIDDIMRQAADAVIPRLEGENIELIVRAEPQIGTLVADAARLRQVFVNLLDNAADFAPVGTPITFTAKRTDDGVAFSIRDRGPGIDKHALDQVFDRFHTEKPGRQRGAGLGLAIVKSFVELHEGKVQIDAAPERGTEVTVTLPEAPSRVSVAAQ